MRSGTHQIQAIGYTETIVLVDHPGAFTMFLDLAEMRSGYVIRSPWWMLRKPESAPGDQLRFEALAMYEDEERPIETYEYWNKQPDPIKCMATFAQAGEHKTRFTVLQRQGVTPITFQWRLRGAL